MSGVKKGERPVATQIRLYKEDKRNISQIRRRNKLRSNAEAVRLALAWANELGLRDGTRKEELARSA